MIQVIGTKYGILPEKFWNAVQIDWNGVQVSRNGERGKVKL